MSRWLSFYQDLYDKEIDIKEKITTRVQIVFTLIIALITVSSYMFRMLDNSVENWLIATFYLLGIIFLIFLIIASYYAVRTFWGNEFKLIPSSTVFYNYWTSLDEYKEATIAWGKENPAASENIEIDFPDSDNEFQKYLLKAYVDCAGHNCNINQARQRRMHISFRHLLLSLIPLTALSVVFIGFDLDRSSPSRSMTVAGEILIGNIEPITRNLNSAINEIKEIKEILGDMTSDNKAPTNEKSGGNAPKQQAAPAKPDEPAYRVVLDNVKPEVILGNTDEQKE